MERGKDAEAPKIETLQLVLFASLSSWQDQFSLNREYDMTKFSKNVSNYYERQSSHVK